MIHPFKQRRLGEILINKQFIKKEQLEQALKHNDEYLGERLLKDNSITEAQLFEAFADQFDINYINLDDFTISQELFNILSARHAYDLNVVPYKCDGDELDVVISDPFDLTLPERLERITGLQINLLLSTKTAIQSALKRSEGSSAVFKDISGDFRPAIVKQTDDGKEETVVLDAVDDVSAPVVRLINSMLMAALQKRASDIHIETYEHGITIKNRIDGVLYPATEVLDQSHHSALVSRLKVMAELDIAEKRTPQDGRFKLRINNKDIDFRVSILPSVFGEDVVIRILDKSMIKNDVEQLSIENLGMMQNTITQFRRAIREPYGMVLITGPTGSGKTTTLYAAITELNSGAEKIITIEDPVEYQLNGIIQIPVNEKKDLTFAKGLRSILRHDPDKIMVGEIRDQETAQIAVQSALTGHLVFTTVHANNAFDVIGRFTHMGIDIYNFVSALNCVMAQRLVRINCQECKSEIQVANNLLELSSLDPEKYSDHTWYGGTGCAHCGGTGYRGRTAITEFLDLSPQIREMIINRCPVSELQVIAEEGGMMSLRQAALEMALSGETTLQEINRVTFVD